MKGELRQVQSGTLLWHRKDGCPIDKSASLMLRNGRGHKEVDVVQPHIRSWYAPFQPVQYTSADCQNALPWVQVKKRL
jgi:hypothetical protein